MRPTTAFGQRDQANFRPWRLALWIPWLVPIAPAPASGSDAEPGPEAVRFFESEVRPLLIENCISCHGPKKQGGKLRLDSRAGVLSGGDSGPAAVPGKPEESLLVEAIEYQGLEMPPKGKLSDERRAILTRWIAMGTPWPGGDEAIPAPTAEARPKITDEDRAFWSFQPVRHPEPPAVDDGGWSRNAIDRFVFAKLRESGLTPAPEADRTTLIRRLSFDLLGLPPTPEAVDAFVADARPEAYDELVESMLASPRYGERWARHWLDLVRYADSDGYNEDAERPDAFRYRDYVVKAFNEDRPYNRFAAEQLAGDEIDPDDPELRVAAGYLRLGTYEYNQRDVHGQWDTILNDITDVTGDVFLGMGLACARCHDHKFDPILQRDYFRLRAFFEPIWPRDEFALASPGEKADHDRATAAWEADAAPILAQIADLERPILEKEVTTAFNRFSEEIQALLKKPRAERTPAEHLIAELAYRQIVDEHKKLPAVMKKGKVKKEWEELQKRLAESATPRPAPLPTAMTVCDVGPIAPPTYIPGDRSKTPVEPGFLTLLDPSPASIVPVAPESTGRRSALAAWIGRADNPLTTRVAVNRVWQSHFGRGLVGTSSDFGRKGDRPSHPELLDWLASTFVQEGWSLKAMHRLILRSATYRQGAEHPAPEVGMKADPENRLLWRMTSRRLEVEPIHDAILAVSGELDASVGGPAVDFSKPRRMVYLKVLRNKRDPLSDGFDAPDSSSTTPQRNISVTPLQALLMINGPWGLERARGFARRVGDAAPDEDGRVELAYRLAFGRRPDPSERADARAFLRDQAARSAEEPEKTALVDFCHALLNASEFLYVD
ncbi:PSD1 and planctomycete cytochrome C domain-containing protein [Tundrisphaera sp. TA3]|uniref:PSD1 and planctomycete cytochrome C domain-containing protein n=1 Tax=Tundrisphaera sp. TA3 TaxID=3435775 RepID=UPI003EB7FCB4